jgi:hypothetical protein
MAQGREERGVGGERGYWGSAEGERREGLKGLEIFNPKTETALFQGISKGVVGWVLKISFKTPAPSWWGRTYKWSVSGWVGGQKRGTV